jgi:hypothetical protein
VIRPVLWYASQSWTLAKKSELALDAFERKVFRRTLGSTKENDAWRIRYNNELYKQFDEPSLSNIIKLKRLQWAGHVNVWRGNAYRKGFWKASLLEKSL